MHAEYIYQQDGDEIMAIEYNEFGFPQTITPTGNVLASLNVTFSDKGQVTSWTHGDRTFSIVYDQRTSLKTEKILSNKATYRYQYKHGRKVY